MKESPLRTGIRIMNDKGEFLAVIARRQLDRRSNPIMSGRCDWIARLSMTIARRRVSW